MKIHNITVFICLADVNNLNVASVVLETVQKILNISSECINSKQTVTIGKIGIKLSHEQLKEIF